MANTKQFGLRGIANDVQLGKAGGRFIYDNVDGVFKFTGSDGATLVSIRAAAPINNNDIATKGYVDSLSSGLDPKQSVRVATTANIANLAGGAPNVVDGVTLQVGDRVLVKDQTIATENGIYVVDTVGTGATGSWSRASDMDGSPAAEVSGGNYTFVEQGSTNINTGWVVKGDGILSLGTDPIVWVQFSGAGSITAGVGLTKVGESLSVDLFDADPNPIAGFVGTVDGANDVLLFGDQSAGTTHTITVDALFNDMDVVKGITANGFITRTADDQYASRSIAVDGAGNKAGLSVTDGAGAAGDPTLGLDILGTAARSSALTTTSSFIAHNATSSANEKFTFADLISDLSLVTDPGAGLIKSTGTGFVATSITAGTGAEAGISVTGEQIGLNITGLSAVPSLDTADQIVVYDASGLANAKATVQDVIDLVAANTSDNEISQNNTSVTITDVTTGTIDFVVDAVNVMSISGTSVALSAGATLKLDAAEIDNGVVYAAADGTLETTAGFTFNGTDLAVPGAITAGGAVTASVFDGGFTNTRILFGNAAGEIAESANLTFNGSALGVTGSISASSDITSTAGNISTTTGTITAGGGLIDSTLTVANAVTFSDATGNLTEDAAFTFNPTGTVLSIDNINIDGNTISTTNTNGDLVLAPNGTGDVVIGNAGSPAQLIAEDGQSLTVAAGAGTAGTGGDLNLLAGDGTGANAGGNVIIAAGDSGTGTEGTTQLKDANDNLVAEITNKPAATDGHVDLAAGAEITADGTGANIDLKLTPKGTGTVLVPAGYESNITNDSLVNKTYVDSLVAANVTPGSVGSISATIDLTSGTVQSIGTIPANATVLRVTVRVTQASDAVTLVDIGDATNGASSYMTNAEIDAEAVGVYAADSFVENGGTAVTANATVATPGTAGSAKVIIEYRNA